MYDFVLKLNLATTEGKERFMRRWAVGRISNGESTAPAEGLKFLHSLGINVANKVRCVWVASHVRSSPDLSEVVLPGTSESLGAGC